MAKLLYISANSKPEPLSVSKTMARYFIDEYCKKYPEDTVEELDLYSEDIPMPNYKLFTSRATLTSGEAYEDLSDCEKSQISRIEKLSDQFLNADKYLIAAPMWNTFFPSILKQYIDCIVLNGRLIEATNNEVKGLLNDKERKMVYIQSSGGYYPAFISWRLNLGVRYLQDVFGFLGISTFKQVLVEGVDMPEIGKEVAMRDAKEDIDHILKRF